jgi:hypothetical protein
MKSFLRRDVRTATLPPKSAETNNGYGLSEMEKWDTFDADPIKLGADLNGLNQERSDFMIFPAQKGP